MKPFRDLPIQRKMLVMTLVIVGTILLVAVAALFSFQIQNFRSNFQSDTETLAVIIANNSTAALDFKDAGGGAEVVGSLKAVPTVVSATLVTPDGTLFAQFGKPEPAGAWAQFPPPRESRFTGGYLLRTQPVILNKKQVGTLYLRANFQRTFSKLLEFYGFVILDIAILSISLAIFLSRRFQRVITDPVLHLAETAQRIGREKNYAVRAAASGRGDELGQLTESFNEMLDRIQSQDSAIGVSQQRMQVLINSIDGIVWTCDPDKFRFSFVSRQCLRILGFAPDEWLANADFWQDHLHPEDKAKTVQLRHDYARIGRPYTCEYRMLAADERVVWIRESGSVMAEQGKASAMRGIFLDITAQKTADEELARLNSRLLESSRMAGMAEVATGVLHNVGNVLNSVSVSATLVGERLKQSRVANLRRATAMLHEHMDRLFEPFFTTKAPGKGTGLGLATVLSIIRQHKGWLEVESQPGQGTTFKLYFPASQQPAGKPAAADDDGELQRGRETILVAEDEDPLREMIAELLEYQGYKVLTARSGRHALEVWQAANREVDLLVTDLIMPEGILGGELAELLLAQKPGLKVIFTSGYSPDMAGKDISLVEGINFMAKPYSIGKMAQLVRQCLDTPVNPPA